MLEVKDGKFLLDGENFEIFSGAIHYFRILPEYWEDRLSKLKAAGFNTVETYVCWNLHEPQKGKFDFEGRLDIVRFIETARKLGLYVILRPGPYICAEWDFGGFPAWLLKDKNIRLRCMEPNYIGHVSDYYKELFKRVAPLQCTRGGNIIAMQVENEYGSYGNDKTYLQYMKQLMSDCGAETLLFTADGPTQAMLSGGTLPDTFKMLNFGSGARGAFNVVKDENVPKMCGEFWCGWFDHWGERHHTRGVKTVEYEINGFLNQGASFNFYMFCGGTNFGFTAGANYGRKYQPTVTSYDYSALLTEWGGYTPSYFKVREMLCAHRGIQPPTLPPVPLLQSVGRVALTERASLWDNLENIGEKHTSAMPESMEYFGQNFGMIYYKTRISGKYGPMSLQVKGVHDRAYIYLDGALKKTVDRVKSKKDGASFLVPSIDGTLEVGVLVDAMGRVNYGDRIYDAKGIGGIKLGYQNVMEYEVVTLPLDNVDKVEYGGKSDKYPMFFRGEFKAEVGKDCFVRLDGFVKGSVYVNGFNLGRYWKKGPQKTLYLPGALLKADNEIVVLELEGCKSPEITLTDVPDLD